MDLAITKNPKSQRIVYTILLMTLLWSSLFAQEINESSRHMSFGKQNSFSLELEETSKDDVMDAWLAYVKENKYGKIKRNKKADEWVGQNLKVSSISVSRPTGIYTKAEQKENTVIMTSWVDLGDRFVSTNNNPEEAIAFTAILEDFYFYSKRRTLERDLKSEEKKLSKDKKTLSKLEKKQSKLEKSIEKNKEKIEKAENDIEVLANDKLIQLDKVEKERSLLQDVYDKDGSPEMIKKQKNELKKAEKGLNKIKKTSRKLKDNITKMSRQNEDNTEAIEELLIDQEGQKQIIERQEAKINVIKEKIDDLKV